ncbi:TetR/AcrR family transcriptional regulator [Acidovorax sp.]|uniref:TetR/AcrR family transcriptional regulator n=1 Tax=Acidovorax sp. TaxID=1872122 RepID=UPI00391F15D1
MPRTPPAAPPPEPAPRRRMARHERARQLLDVAWALLRAEGADALSLGRLAEEAGVTKPVVYDHFGTREGLLAALYQDFDVRQTAVMDAAIAAARPTLKDKAGAIAAAYVRCVLTQGREIPQVLAALQGSPEMAAVKRQYQEVFIAKCLAILAPFAGEQGLARAGLWAVLGAADALSDAAVVGDISAQAAQAELFETIVSMVKRAK